MASDVHPSLDEIDWLIANPEEAPNPPLMWMCWADWWEKILAANRPGFIEFHLYEVPEGYDVFEMCDDQLVFARHVPTCREALKVFADRLDGGLPRGTVLSSCGPHNNFALHRIGKSWFYHSLYGNTHRTQKCGSFKRGLLALAHWAANCGMPREHICVVAFRKPSE